VTNAVPAMSIASRGKGFVQRFREKVKGRPRRPKTRESDEPTTPDHRRADTVDLLWRTDRRNFRRKVAEPRVLFITSARHTITSETGHRASRAPVAIVERIVYFSRSEHRRALCKVQTEPQAIRYCGGVRALANFLGTARFKT
jgi:hypothetical protein